MYLWGGVVINNRLETTPLGVPQGGVPLSPLLANIMLDDLDKELEKLGLTVSESTLPDTYTTLLY